MLGVFALGAVCGAWFGMVVMAVLVAASDRDEPRSVTPIRTAGEPYKPR